MEINKITQLENVEDLELLIHKDIVNLNSLDYEGKLMYLEEPRGIFNGFYRTFNGRIIKHEINETNIDVKEGCLVEKGGEKIKQLSYRWFNAGYIFDMFLPILNEINLRKWK